MKLDIFNSYFKSYWKFSTFLNKYQEKTNFDKILISCLMKKKGGSPPSSWMGIVILFIRMVSTLIHKCRIVHDTDLAGYPANHFSGHRLNNKYRIYFLKKINIFSFQQNLPTFLFAIWLFLFYTYWKGSEKGLFIKSSHYLFNNFLFSRLYGQIPDIKKSEIRHNPS